MQLNDFAFIKNYHNRLKMFLFLEKVHKITGFRFNNSKKNINLKTKIENKLFEKVHFNKVNELKLTHVELLLFFHFKSVKFPAHTSKFSQMKKMLRNSSCKLL